MIYYVKYQIYNIEIDFVRKLSDNQENSLF